MGKCRIDLRFYLDFNYVQYVLHSHQSEVKEIETKPRIWRPISACFVTEISSTATIFRQFDTAECEILQKSGEWFLNILSAYFGFALQFRIDSDDFFNSVSEKNWYCAQGAICSELQIWAVSNCFERRCVQETNIKGKCPDQLSTQLTMVNYYFLLFSRFRQTKFRKKLKTLQSAWRCAGISTHRTKNLLKCWCFFP